MRLIKRLDMFILRNFLSLFAGTFCISLFVVMMQFLWKYIDQLVGKGLTFDIYAKFFFYAAETLVPLALPLAILLASLISFGNIGERLELLAIKAAGISLFRTLRPLIILVALLSLTSFHFQNKIAPDAEQKLLQLLTSMRMKSPELDIPEGVFYDGIENINLY
ncbi:MAG: LptF/LptG family permease, partial [Bacteroidaceae bacterium]|nr:LptF/LptG family permease [Bacteroidaceae bacterium]